MLIVQSKIHSSIVFIDKNIAYVGPFVLILNTYNVFIFMYKGWYLAIAFHAVLDMMRWVHVTEPAKYIAIDHSGIMINKPNSHLTMSQNFMDGHYKRPVRRVEFNINFICSGLRRDVFVHSYDQVKCFNCLPIINWLISHKK